MAHNIEDLKREIESLEKQLAGQHFGGLFDPKRIERLEDKLKKRRKELARLEAGDDDDLDGGAEHIEIPGFHGAIVDAPGLVPDFPGDLDHDEPSPKKTTTKSPTTLSGKVVGKAVAKPAKKAAAKSKTAAKLKPKAKPASNKKSAAKPAKKKSKR